MARSPARWTSSVHPPPGPRSQTVQIPELVVEVVPAMADGCNAVQVGPVGVLLAAWAGRHVLVREVLAVGDGKHHHADACEDVAVIVGQGCLAGGDKRVGLLTGGGLVGGSREQIEARPSRVGPATLADVV
jgi:hypothetical protein